MQAGITLLWSFWFL